MVGVDTGIEVCISRGFRDIKRVLSSRFMDFVESIATIDEILESTVGNKTLCLFQQIHRLFRRAGNMEKRGNFPCRKSFESELDNLARRVVYGAFRDEFFLNETCKLEKTAVADLE